MCCGGGGGGGGGGGEDGDVNGCFVGCCGSEGLESVCLSCGGSNDRSSEGSDVGVWRGEVCFVGEGGGGGVGGVGGGGGGGVGACRGEGGGCVVGGVGDDGAGGVGGVEQNLIKCGSPCVSCLCLFGGGVLCDRVVLSCERYFLTMFLCSVVSLL